MPCYLPMPASYKDEVNPKNGKRGITFIARRRLDEADLLLPCGNCIGCRLERSRQWALRISHEASLHPQNSFLTLTYNEESLPENGSLNKEDFKNFMKRLRKSIEPKKIKFYQCGEYGEKFSRPHHHCCLFNHDFPDKKLFKTKNGYKTYTSQILDDLWKHGECKIGTLTFESAAYVSRYITKKVNGPLRDEHYTQINSETGEIFFMQPEYATMSRGGKKKGSHGIAAEWFKKYNKDCYPKDFVTVRGKKMKPAKYYDRLLEALDPALYDDIKAQREELTNQEDNTPWRLKDRLKVKEAQIQNLTRHMETQT
ncbi:replication initiator protein [Microviridae sp.]|nr:replication initiator protein [Microviridae sp.]